MSMNIWPFLHKRGYAYACARACLSVSWYVLVICKSLRTHATHTQAQIHTYARTLTHPRMYVFVGE